MPPIRRGLFVVDYFHELKQKFPAGSGYILIISSICIPFGALTFLLNTNVFNISQFICIKIVIPRSTQIKQIKRI